MNQKPKRWTKERQEIFDFISSHHLVSSGVLEEKFPHIWRASIFRTLKTFLELSIIRRINLWTKFDQYELVDETGDAKHHEHMKCTECQKIMSFESDFICKLLTKVCQNKNFQLKEHAISLLGICNNCQ